MSFPHDQQQFTLPSASLYVGDLDKDVSDQKLYELFNNIGQVQSIRVLRDMTTHKSLGYAYVNFHRSKDAEFALDMLNNKEINGRPCRIMFSQRNPDIRRSGKGNIFVKGLPPTMDQEALQNTFSQFGDILSCKVAANSKGNRLGYGFVHFQDEAHANRAIAEVNGKCLDQNPNWTTRCFVTHFKPKSQRPGGDNFTNVYFKNMPRSVSEEKVLDMFREFGQITNHKYVTFLDEKKCNFGFVNFETPQMARAAIQNLHEKQIIDKIITVCRALRKEDRERSLRESYEKKKADLQAKGYNLFVKNLPESMNNDGLLALFRQFGTITSGVVMRDGKDAQAKSKCFGFVCFEEQQAANNAIRLNGTLVDKKPLYVAMAQRKADRAAMMAERFLSIRNAKASQQTYQPSWQPRGYALPGVAGFGPGWHQQAAFMNRGPQNFHLVPGQLPAPGGRGAPRRQGRGGRQGTTAPQMRAQPTQPGQVRYNDNARNASRAPQQAAPVGNTASSEDVSAQDFASKIARLPSSQRKVAFGERLYPLVYQVQPDLAPKITGMLLEMDDPEIIELLESQTALSGKIQEALRVLEESVSAVSESS